LTSTWGHPPVSEPLASASAGTPARAR
jgi:hypothetical protein